MTNRLQRTCRTRPRRRSSLATTAAPILLAAALILPASASAVPAGVAEKLDVGGEWVGSVFQHPAWAQLNAGRARLAVPWDIARPSDSRSPRAIALARAERAEFDHWVTAAQAAGVEPYVTFWYSDQRHCRGRGLRVCRTPTVESFELAFRAFRANPAWAHIQLFSAWNEPNFLKRRGPVPVKGFRTPDKRHWFHTANCRGRERAAACGPMAAAHYYLTILRVCPACNPVAGEFTSRIGRGTLAYWNAYRGYLGAHVPETWAIHPYEDIVRYQRESRPTPERTAAPVTKSFARWVLAGPRRASSGDPVQIWLTAVGARVVNSKGQPVGRDPERLQCSAAAFINRLPTVSEGQNAITRYYYYNFRSLGRPVQDFGLVAPDGRPRTAFYRFARRSGHPC